MFRRRKGNEMEKGARGKGEFIESIKNKTTRTKKQNQKKDRWGDEIDEGSFKDDRNNGSQSITTVDTDWEESHSFVVEDDDSIQRNPESEENDPDREHQTSSKSIDGDTNCALHERLPISTSAVPPGPSPQAIRTVPETDENRTPRDRIRTPAPKSNDLPSGGDNNHNNHNNNNDERPSTGLRRKVLVFPSIRKEHDLFAIDKNDYRVVCDVLSLADTTSNWRHRVQDLVTIDERGIDDNKEGALRVTEIRVPSTVKDLPQSMGDLKCLVDLNLSNTYQLSNLPEGVFELFGLRTLVLQRSAIASLSSSIGKLQNLKELDLSFTKKLTSLPETIGELTGLTKLELRNSAITALPPSIGGLQNLDQLNLSFTKGLSTLPEEIGNLLLLTELRLQHSAITTIPASMSRLRNLRSLDLSFSAKFVDLPEDAIGGMIGLTTLDLQNTAIISLPASIGKLQRLRFLDLSRTHPVLKLPGENGKAYKLYDQTKTCSSLGSFGRLVDIDIGFAIWNNTPHAKELYCALAYNRARSRMMARFPAMTPSLWPHLLEQGTCTRAFEDYPILNDEPRTMAHLMARRETLVTEPDAIYQLLLHGTESFVGVLLNHYRQNQRHFRDHLPIPTRKQSRR